MQGSLLSYSSLYRDPKKLQRCWFSVYRKGSCGYRDKLRWYIKCWDAPQGGVRFCCPGCRYVENGPYVMTPVVIPVPEIFTNLGTFILAIPMDERTYLP